MYSMNQKRAKPVHISDKRLERSEVNLSVPWDLGLSLRTYFAWLRYNSIGTSSEDVAKLFVKERTRLHESYIREQERTKRVGLILSAILILAAAGMVLFAPSGRETLSYWIGAALVIFAGGAGGYKRVWGKTKSITFAADQDQRKLSQMSHDAPK